MKLYEIKQEHQQALAVLEQMEDLTEGEIQDSLAAIRSDFDDKAISIGSFIKNLEADRDAIKEAEKNMAVRAKALGNRIDSIKSYLLHNMENCGISEIKCPSFVIKLKKCPPSVMIINEKSIPEGYWVEKKEINKRKIKSVLEDIKKGFVGDERLLKMAELVSRNRLEIK